MRSPVGREVEAAVAADLRARAAYVVDSRVRADLTYLYCADEGSPDDRRRLWARATAGEIRLLPLPGRHGSFTREPQYSALASALGACLDGSATPTGDVAQAFNRRYVIERADETELVRDPGGASFPLTVDRTVGRVRAVKPMGERLVLRGWAGDPEGGSPAETVVAFVDGEYAGHTTCGLPTARLAKRRAAPGLQRAGFRIRAPLPAGWPSAVVRVFALARDGCARELPVRRRPPAATQRRQSTGPARNT
jgi:hypothetical protein